MLDLIVNVTVNIMVRNTRSKPIVRSFIYVRFSSSHATAATLLGLRFCVKVVDSCKSLQDKICPRYIIRGFDDQIEIRERQWLTVNPVKQITDLFSILLPKGTTDQNIGLM